VSLDRALTLAGLVERLATVKRVTAFATERERVTDHTVMLQLLVLDMVMGPDIDTLALHGVVCQDALAFALVHDLPEALCGDTNTMDPSKVDFAAKEAAERDAFKQIDGMLSRSGAGTVIPVLIDVYERNASPSARFVRYLDKVLPRLLHTRAGGIFFWKNGYSLEQVEALHRTQETALTAQYPEFASTVGVLLSAASRAAEAAYARSLAERQQVVDRVLPWLMETWPGAWTARIGWNSIAFALGGRRAMYFKHPEQAIWWYSDDTDGVIPDDAPRFHVEDLHGPA